MVLTPRSFRYGVDPAVLMAIYGHETSYGSITGSFDLIEVKKATAIATGLPAGPGAPRLKAKTLAESRYNRGCLVRGHR